MHLHHPLFVMLVAIAATCPTGVSANGGTPGSTGPAATLATPSQSGGFGVHLAASTPVPVPSYAVGPLSTYAWENVSRTSGTAPRTFWGSGLAYDAGDGYFLLFGGQRSPSAPPTNETWSYSHGVWTNLTARLATAPPPETDMGMTYDVADGYVVMFGGQGCPGLGRGPEPCNATWKYESGAWTNLTSQLSGNPPHLADPAMTYDSTDGYVVMFGGYGADYNGEMPTNDTWTYRASVWQRMNLSHSPSPRIGMTMVNDGPDGYVFLTGGLSFSPPDLKDSWAYSAGNWTLLNLSDTVSNTAALEISEGPGGSMFGAGCGRWNFYATSCPYLFQYSGGVWTNVSRNGTLAGPWPLPRLSLNPLAKEVLAWGGMDYHNIPRYTTWVLTSPLAATILAAPTPLTFRSSLNLSVNVSGGADPYSFVYSGLPPGCTTNDSPRLSCVPTTWGTFTVRVNVTEGSSLTVTAANTIQILPPTLGLVASAAAIDVNQTIRFVATASDGSAPWSFVWNGLPPECPTTNASRISCTPASPGLYTISVIVSAPSVPAVSSPATRVLVNPLPRVILSDSQTAGELPFAANFSAFAYGGTPPITFRWTFGDGSYANGSAVQHTFTQLGRFTVTVVARDAVGVVAVTDSSSPLTVRVAVPLYVSIAPPAAGHVAPAPIWWNATVAGGFPPYRLEWSFGDGSNGSGESGLHTYERAGNYSVILVATDQLGDVATSVGTVQIVMAPGHNPRSQAPLSSPPFLSPLEVAAILGVALGALAGVTATWVVSRQRRRN